MARWCCRFRCAVWLVAAAAVLAGPDLASAVPTAVPAPSCASSPYAYAGLASNISAQGIQAVVTTLAAPDVQDGHVAGWIGVGGPDAGPDGQAEWLQVGVNTQVGIGSELYAEIALPGQTIEYETLASDVNPGSSYRLAVVELPGQHDVWQVLVNGTPTADRVYLPDSSAFAPMAMSESWDGGSPQCNGFAYHFGQLQIATNGSWRYLTDVSVLADVGYQVTDHTRAGFTALSA